MLRDTENVISSGIANKHGTVLALTDLFAKERQVSLKILLCNFVIPEFSLTLQEFLPSVIKIWLCPIQAILCNGK